MRRRFWLLLPAWCLYAADITMTLVGQSAAYWDGHYAQASEENPIAHPLLAIHPWLFACAAGAWAVIFGLVVVLWRHCLSDWLAILLAFGHAVGGSTWIARHGSGGWVMAITYLIGAAWLTGKSWRRAGLGQMAAESDRSSI